LSGTAAATPTEGESQRTELAKGTVYLQTATDCTPTA